jgi:hypothetical protein
MSSWLTSDSARSRPRDISGLSVMLEQLFGEDRLVLISIGCRRSRGPRRPPDFTRSIPR